MSPLTPSSASAFLSTTATLAARSAIESDFDSFKSSFSSWDSCMSEAYCKWPVIAAIIVASLILLSLLSCAFRCLCCGLECCFGCFACCNACCPAPRGGHRRNRSRGGGADYMPAPQQQQQAWPQQPPQPYGWQPNMVYGGPPSTAVFDAPTMAGANGVRKGAAARALAVGNVDALPPMPSWQTAQSRRVEEDVQEDEETALQEDARQGIAMGNVGGGPARRQHRQWNQQQQARFNNDEQSVPMLLSPQPRHTGQYTDNNNNNNNNNGAGAGASPYAHGYGNHIDTSYAPQQQQQRTRGVRFASPPLQNPSYNNTSSSSSYPPAPPQQQQQQQEPTSYYAPTPTSTLASPLDDYLRHNSRPHSPGAASIPPSYHSRAQTASPVYQQQQQQGGYAQPQLEYPGYPSGGGGGYSGGEYSHGVSRRPVGGGGGGGGGGWNGV